MQRKLMRTLAALFAVAMLATACGGDDEGGDATSETDGGATSEAAGSEAGGDMTAGEDAQGVQDLKDAGTVRVGIKFDQPLFGVQTPDGVEGFDAEIAKLMVEGIFDDGDPESHIEWVETVSANREPFLQNGEVDMVIATYTINDERDEIIDFAGPYYRTGQQLMVAEGNPENIQQPSDLNGKQACSVEGSTSIQRLEEQAPDAEITTFDTYSKCAEALSDGRITAVTTDGAILYGLVSEFGDFEVVGDEFSDEPYGIGVPDGSDDLRLYLNERICQIQQSGEWDTAYEDTVGQVSDTPEPPDIDADRYDQVFPDGSECPQAEGGGSGSSESGSEMSSEMSSGSEMASEMTSEMSSDAGSES